MVRNRQFFRPQQRREKYEFFLKMNSNRFRRKSEIGRPNFNTREIRSRKCLCVRWLLWLFLNQDRHSLGVGFKLSKSAPTRSVYGNRGLASLPQSAISAMRTRTRTRTRTRLPSEYCLWMDSEHFLPTFIVIGACIIISVGALKHCKSTQPTSTYLPPPLPIQHIRQAATTTEASPAPSCSFYPHTICAAATAAVSSCIVSGSSGPQCGHCLSSALYRYCR